MASVTYVRAAPTVFRSKAIPSENTDNSAVVDGGGTSLEEIVLLGDTGFDEETLLGDNIGRWLLNNNGNAECNGELRTSLVDVDSNIRRRVLLASTMVISMEKACSSGTNT